MEDTTPLSFSKAIDINQQLLRRYRELSNSPSPYSSRLFFIPPFLSPESSTPRSASRNPPPSFRTPVTNRMASLIKISPFNGSNADIGESVDEYLDDVETAALSWDLTVNPNTQEATNKSKIRLFRQNLEKDGDAWHWWYYVLPEADKKDYAKVVSEFKDRYSVKASQASSLFAVQNEMLSLSQGETEHIRDYVHRVEKLSRKIPRDMDSLFAIAFIKGMKDQERRQRVTFDLKDSPNFSFVKALEVVKFSFQEIGEPDPFRPQPRAQESESPVVALYSTPPIAQVNAVGKAEVPAGLCTGNSPLSPMMTQDQFNTFMTAYEASIGRIPPNQNRSTMGWMGNRRSNPRITCFNCGVRGHYSDTCTNPTVSQFEQQQIRDRIRREREQSEPEFRPMDRRLDSPLTGANATEVVPRAILPRLPSDKDPILPVQVGPPVSCVRVCAVS